MSLNQAQFEATRRPTTSPAAKLTRFASWLVALGVAVLTMATPRVAWAHAHLVKSSPAANSHLSQSPGVVKLWYSEAADPTLTTVSITRPAGTRASLGKVTADPGNPLLLSVTVDAPLAPGRYTLAWRAVAKDDGHPSSGTFSFVIDSSAATMSGTSAATTDSAHHDSSNATMAGAASATTSAPAQGMSVEAPSYVIARWLNFVALLMVVGAAAFIALVLPRVECEPGVATALDSRATQQAAKLGLAAGVLFLVTSVCRLYAERAVIGGNTPMGTILGSFWGRMWITQAVIALLVCVAFAAARGARRGGPAWLFVAIVSVALAATPAFSGHAIAAPGNKGISVILDVIHIVAAGAWLGGLLTLVLVGVPAALSVSNSTAEAPGALPLVARLVNAFSPLALTFAGLVVATGLVAAWMRLGSIGALFDSGYGTVLLVKLAFVLLVVAGGAFNWLRMRDALAHRETGTSSVGVFRRSAWFELTAGLLVIAATAVLVATQPPVR